jgi:hypothetical protein
MQEQDEEKDPILRSVVDSIRNDDDAAVTNESTFLLLTEETTTEQHPLHGGTGARGGGGGTGHRKSKSLSTLMSPGEREKKKKGGHHRRKSSISQIYDSISGGLSVIREGVVQEGALLNHQFQEELNNANEGEGYTFLIWPLIGHFL